MAFRIELYRNTAEPNRVDKTDFLTRVNNIDGTLKDETSICNMSIRIYYDRFPQFNYVYIPTFNRYYYVTDITIIRNNLYEISLSVDVLMTYKYAILNCYGFIDRNEYINNKNIIDKKLVVEQGYNFIQYEVNNSLLSSSPSFVLTGFALV